MEGQVAIYSISTQKQGSNAREYSILKEVMYVLKYLSKGQQEQDILECDERRVSLWIEFAKDIQLLEQNHSGKWLISDKGRTWIN